MGDFFFKLLGFDILNLMLNPMEVGSLRDAWVS